jgi:hypothetical protein
MEKSKFLMEKVLAIVLICGMTFAGCTTTQHNVEISNVPNIREVYIRNAGTANWGANLAGNLQDIDRSRFSDRVDVRVIDANGIVFSKLNVPFNDAAFVETSSERYIGTGTTILLGLLLLPFSIYAFTTLD